MRLKFASADVKNASMITLSCVIAVFLSRWLTNSQLIWVVIIVALLPFSKVGRTAKARHMSLLCTGMASALAVAVTIFLNATDWWVAFWLFISAFILYCLPRYIAGSYAIGLFILIFMVIAHGMPGSNLVSALQSIPAILLGTFIVISLNGLFDRDKILLPVIPLDKSGYLFQRALRMAIMVTIAFFIGHFFQIQNASWVALTVVIIDQNTLGASMKKACQRLLGTILGVIAGILLAHFLFGPYPLSRWAALLIVFMVFLFVRTNYTVAMFFATILLANIFYLSLGSTTLVSYMISRLVDIIVGIVIGVLGQMLLFPRTLLRCLREGYFQFWSDAQAVVLSAATEKNCQPALIKLEQDLTTIEQNLKDFRYEPISFLFKRYQLSVALIPLIRNFLMPLKNISRLPPEIAQSVGQVIGILLPFYKDPDLNSIEPLQNSLHELAKMEAQSTLDLEGRSLLMNLKKVIEHFQVIIQTPRWRLSS